MVSSLENIILHFYFAFILMYELFYTLIGPYLLLQNIYIFSLVNIPETCRMYSIRYLRCFILDLHSMPIIHAYIVKCYDV